MKLLIDGKRLEAEIQTSLQRIEELGLCDETFCMVKLPRRHIEVQIRVTSDVDDFIGEVIDGVAEVQD